MSDEDIDRLKRGGHDPVKIYAAYHAAANHRGRPTVVLAQTKKGYGMGTWGQGKMARTSRRRTTSRCASSATASRCRYRTRM